MSTILALDLRIATGWALRTPDGQIFSGTQGSKPGRYESGGLRFLRLRGWPSELRACAYPTGDRLVCGKATLDHSKPRRKADWTA